MRARFLFITEGTSDLMLAEHIESLFIENGASEASAVKMDLSILPTPPGNSIKEKVDKAIELEPNIDYIVIHRDEDGVGVSTRESEIIEQTAHLPEKYKVIPFVPVKEMEAWLILDEFAIKRAAENPTCRIDLELPPPKSVEKITNPKKFLRDKLIQASELSGGRLAKFKEKFPQKRAYLAQTLQTNSTVTQTKSHSRLCQHIADALR